MTKDAERHLAKARDLVARGEDFYRKAAEEIVAARNEGATLEECAESLDRSRTWVSDTLKWYLRNGKSTRSGMENAPTPYAEQSGAVARRHAKSVLRDAPPEEIAEMLSEPAVRAKVRQAESIATSRAASLPTKRAADDAFREAVGHGVADDLENLQAMRDVSAELTKARVGLNGAFHRLNAVGLENVPDAWREEYLSALDDIAGKCSLGRDLLTGASDDALEQLLAGEV